MRKCLGQLLRVVLLRTWGWQVISRDIHRTFPEHPQFGFEQGQQALFRVLKAYSLHDLEVRPRGPTMHS